MDVHWTSVLLGGGGAIFLDRMWNWCMWWRRKPQYEERLNDLNEFVATLDLHMAGAGEDFMPVDSPPGQFDFGRSLQTILEWSDEVCDTIRKYPGEESERWLARFHNSREGLVEGLALLVPDMDLPMPDVRPSMLRIVRDIQAGTLRGIREEASQEIDQIRTVMAKYE